MDTAATRGKVARGGLGVVGIGAPWHGGHESEGSRGMARQAWSVSTGRAPDRQRTAGKACEARTGPAGQARQRWDRLAGTGRPGMGLVPRSELVRQAWRALAGWSTAAIGRCDADRRAPVGRARQARRGFAGLGRQGVAGMASHGQRGQGITAGMVRQRRARAGADRRGRRGKSRHGRGWIGRQGADRHVIAWSVAAGKV